MLISLARSVALFAVFVLVAGGCQEQNQPQEESETAGQVVAESSDRKAELASTIDGLEEVWNTGDYDRLDTVFAADFRRDGPDQDVEGLETQQAFMESVRTAYSGFRIEFEETAIDADQDLAFVYWRVTGTAGDRSVDVPGMTLLRFDDAGRITEEIVLYDTATLQSQVASEDLPHVE